MIAFAPSAQRVDDLELALGLALSWLIHHEPGDSRAVSNEFVAMAAIQAGLTERIDECRDIIRAAQEIENTKAGAA